MIRDVTIIKVRALIFDLVNFKALDGDIYDVSKKYNLDAYHLSNIRALGWVSYDKKSNALIWQVKERVNVEELTSIVVAKYVETKRRTAKKEYSYTISPVKNKPASKANNPKKKKSLFTKIKIYIYALLRK